MHRGKAQSPEAVPAVAATRVGGQPHGRESTTRAPCATTSRRAIASGAAAALRRAVGWGGWHSRPFSRRRLSCL